ncbi:MAG: hypothetical protein NPIRA04_29680 [Nitrospirales bacterium]|nr:MAG: hypothetical protein NPIRA04_29680 [Nitrospirales bacterium]
MFGKSSNADADQSSGFTEGATSMGNAKPFDLEKAAGDIIAFVGEGVTFKGTIRYKGSVRVDGRLEGEIFTDGILIVGEKAVISAKIEAGTIACQGRITGDIMAKERVKLMSPAVFEGSVKTPSISMDEGVLFNGTCVMPKAGESKSKETSFIGKAEETLKVS